MIMKSLYTSRTFLLAVAQAIIGLAIVAFSELDLVGYATMAKSVGDMLLRWDTKTEVTL